MYLDTSRVLRNKTAVPEFAILSTMPRQKVKILIGKIDDARQKVKWREDENLLEFRRRHPRAILYFPWKTRDLERYVGFIVDRPIVGKVGSFDAKV